MGLKSQVTGDLFWQGNEDPDPSPSKRLGTALNLAQVSVTSSK